MQGFALMRRLFVAIVLLAGACSDATGPADQGVLLAQAEALWSRRAIVNYHFTITRFCECIPESAGPVVVQVLDGEVLTRRYLTGTAVDPQYDDLFRTVPGLFDTIREAIAAPAAAVSVSYNGSYGYPESIQIDWVAGLADDEVSYRITDFAPALP